MQNLQTTYLGLKLKNPIIASSSGLTGTVEGIKKLADAGVSAVVLKSIFEEEILLETEKAMAQMSSQRFVYPETVEFYEEEEECVNLSSDYLELITKAKEAVDIPIIASINCVTAEQWTYFPKLVEAAGADALELNIFLLPSDPNRSQEDNEKIYLDIIKKVKEKVKIPVTVKISSYFSSIVQFTQKLVEAKVDGLVLFNRYYNPDFDIDTMEVTAGGVLSTPSDFYTSLRWISILSGRIDCDLAASTGVHDGATLVKQLLAGANAVELASTIYKHGHKRVNEMLSDLEKWMEKHNFSSIDEFKGKLSQKDSRHPAAYERVQFMKHFRNFNE